MKSFEGTNNRNKTITAAGITIYRSLRELLPYRRSYWKIEIQANFSFVEVDNVNQDPSDPSRSLIISLVLQPLSSATERAVFAKSYTSAKRGDD